MEKTIILCADDFSLNSAINAGIFSLLEAGRLTAVSCMTQSPSWYNDAAELLPWRAQADIGLHFNLTQPFPASYACALPLLMLQSKLGLVARKKIRDSLCKQLDAFEQAIQSAPDFIDGHQHVHIFAFVRDIVHEEYQRRYASSKHKPYIRSLKNMPADQNNCKAKILQWMGAGQHTQLLERNNIPYNHAFGGIYDFNPKEDYDQRMQSWLDTLPSGSLVMCHPATDDAVSFSNDQIAKARCNEYNYLSSDKFSKSLLGSNVVLQKNSNKI